MYSSARAWLVRKPQLVTPTGYQDLSSNSLLVSGCERSLAGAPRTDSRCLCCRPGAARYATELAGCLSGWGSKAPGCQGAKGSSDGHHDPARALMLPVLLGRLSASAQHQPAETMGRLADWRSQWITLPGHASVWGPFSSPWLPR